MREWLTLMGFCFATFSNGLCFGTYTNNQSYFANYFLTTQYTISSTFNIGLITEALLCVFAIRVIYWRFDYAIISAAYLTACGTWLQFFADGNVVLLFASLILCSIAQLCMLPTPLYLAELWFPLYRRSLVIGIGFYANLLGFGLGGTLSGLLSVPHIKLNVYTIILFNAIMATISFCISAVFVKNAPKVRFEAKKRVEWKHVKDLWRQKFTAYNVIMVSVFLGVSWSFLSQFENLQLPSGSSTAALNLAWIISGGGFGLIMSWVVQKWLVKTGDCTYYDRTCKITLLFGVVGNIVLGVLVTFKIEHFSAYLAAVIVVGVGTIGFFGLAFMSLIYSMYPIPAIMIGSIIALFASVYSIICYSVSDMFPEIVNPYLSIAWTTFLPWVYYLLAYETNFKRYKYYLNEKESRFYLLRVEIDTQVSQKGDD